MRKAASLAMCAVLASPARADLEGRVDEGAPKDRFKIINTGGCASGATAVAIDLEGSPYGLIFDVTGQRAGVQVFQPFEVSSVKEKLKARPQVTDSDNQVTVELVGLQAGESASFTIDVDDAGNSRQTIVSNQEIIGAPVVAQGAGGASEATFQDNAVALVELSECMP